MRKKHAMSRFAIMLLALLLVACDAYTETGSRSDSHQNLNGGKESVSTKKANGTIEKEIEIDAGGVSILVADVTLTVGTGLYRIELIGENDQVTLTLEARDGQTVSGHGQMAVVSYEASYRVTAAEAENVEYTIDYAFR